MQPFPDDRGSVHFQEKLKVSGLFYTSKTDFRDEYRIVRAYEKY